VCVRVYMVVCVCDIVRPMHVQLHEGQHMCAVCNDVANGVHFGALTCEGCKVHSDDIRYSYLLRYSCIQGL